MNADQLKGKWMQFKGELKKQWGKCIGNELQQIEGSFDKILGILQERNADNCVSLARAAVRREERVPHELGGPMAARVSAESHAGKDAQMGIIKRR